MTLLRLFEFGAEKTEKMKQAQQYIEKDPENHQIKTSFSSFGPAGVISRGSKIAVLPCFIHTMIQLTITRLLALVKRRTDASKESEVVFPPFYNCSSALKWYSPLIVKWIDQFTDF